MEQLTKNQAVATSQEAVQNQNEPQLRDENAHNDKSVHGVLNPTYQAGLRRDRKSGSAGMPRPNSYAVFCLKKKTSRKGGVDARSNKKSRSYLVPRRRGGSPFCSPSENLPGL